MFIEEAGLFKGIASHVINQIVEVATEELLPAGHVLFQKGDFADYLYILEEGAINITFPGQKPISFPVNKPGHMIGWSALVEPNQYTAAAECVRESRVIKIDGERLMRVFEKHPADGLRVMKRLAGVIASRLEDIYQQISI